MTPREKLIEELKDRATKLGLTFVHNKASFWMAHPQSGERFVVMDGRMCLCADEDPALVEKYLLGYRDGRRSVLGTPDKNIGDKIGAALDWIGEDDDTS